MRYASETRSAVGEAHRSGRGPGRLAGLAGTAVALLVLASCDITNPGPIHDEFLSDPQSHVGMVNGAARSLVEALNMIAMTGAITARELFPGGQTGAVGHNHPIQAGALPASEVASHWSNAQRARFVAEEAIHRFTSPGIQVDPTVLAQAYIYAGFANRLLGENMCQVVFDGGPARPSSDALMRAEEQFTAALGIAGRTTDQDRAAHAGRAQVRLAMGDWSGAAADARMVPSGWTMLLHAAETSSSEHNRLFTAINGQPHRSHTVRFTFYDEYYPETGDPRVAWATRPGQPVCTANLTGFGQVPFTYYTNKHNALDAPFTLASGSEMRLIEAEVLLHQTPGGWAQALALINEVRSAVISDVTGEPLEPWAANSLEETWTALMRERGIELWLEARRLHDLRRWEELGVPGDMNLPDFESVASFLGTYTPDDRCFPISEAEQQRNTNINPADVINSRWGL